MVIDDDLTFDKHIAEKVNKANKIMGLIRRTFEYLDAEMFCLLFRSLVRPHIEYANPVWAPHLKKHIDSIENVQRRASKQIPGMEGLSYEDRLRKLDMPSLAYRRLRGDMIEVFKILSPTCGYDKQVAKGLLRESTTTWTRGHEYKLEQRRARLDLRKFNFTYRVVQTWNSLPAEVVSAENVVTFKHRLDRHWKNRSVIYDYRAEVTAIS